MALHYEFEIFGDTQVSRTLLNISKRATDMRPVGEALFDDFLRIEKAQFETEGGYASNGWAPLSRSRSLRKAARNLDPRILHATNALRISLSQRNGAGQVKAIGQDEFVFGSRVPYAKFHQSSSPRSQIPLRRPVELRESDRRAWVRAIQSWIIRNTPRVEGRAG